MNVAEESAWGDEPTYYNEGAEFEELRRNQQFPPPIPPLPDHYSARPNNLPVQDNGQPSQINGDLPASPLYENTTVSNRQDSYTEAITPTSIDSPRNEPWFHGKLKRNDVSWLLSFLMWFSWFYQVLFVHFRYAQLSLEWWYEFWYKSVDLNVLFERWSPGELHMILSKFQQ